MFEPCLIFLTLLIALPISASDNLGSVRVELDKKTNVIQGNLLILRSTREDYILSTSHFRSSISIHSIKTGRLYFNIPGAKHGSWPAIHYNENTGVLYVVNGGSGILEAFDLEKRVKIWELCFIVGHSCNWPNSFVYSANHQRNSGILSMDSNSDGSVLVINTFRDGMWLIYGEYKRSVKVPREQVDGPKIVITRVVLSDVGDQIYYGRGYDLMSVDVSSWTHSKLYSLEEGESYKFFYDLHYEDHTLYALSNQGELIVLNVEEMKFSFSKLSSTKTIVIPVSYMDEGPRSFEELIGGAAPLEWKEEFNRFESLACQYTRPGGLALFSIETYLRVRLPLSNEELSSNTMSRVSTSVGNSIGGGRKNMCLLSDHQYSSELYFDNLGKTAKFVDCNGVRMD